MAFEKRCNQYSTELDKYPMKLTTAFRVPSGCYYQGFSLHKICENNRGYRGTENITLYWPVTPMVTISNNLFPMRFVQLFFFNVQRKH